jgi:hypothetical protein
MAAARIDQDARAGGSHGAAQLQKLLIRRHFPPLGLGSMGAKQALADRLPRRSRIEAAAAMDSRAGKTAKTVASGQAP